MRIKKKDVKGFTVVSLAGAMEAYDAERFENEVMETIKKGKKDIIIDFRNLEYISSSGLRALLNIRSRLIEEGGRLRLVALRDKVLEVFRISKLLGTFEIYKDVEDAVKP